MPPSILPVWIFGRPWTSPRSSDRERVCWSPPGSPSRLPDGYEAQIRPRSGLALKHGIGILNSPGTIDADYRGEVRIILTNFGTEEFVIGRGDRIAQMVVAPYVRARWEEVDALDETTRGAGGFGHTGR